MRRLSTGILAVALLFAEGNSAAIRPAPEEELTATRVIDGRVATIGHRLAVASLDLCSAREWRHGLVFVDIGQASPAARDAMGRWFGQTSGLGITAVAAGGPAERAGLRPGDVILSLDGSVDTGPVESPEAILARVPSALADGQIDFVIRRGTARLVLPMRAELGCVSAFRVTQRGSRNAKADGMWVNINRGLVTYAQDDAELAAAIAHELAHNILQHRIRLYGDESRRGSRRPGTRSIRETEIEADRLSVYLMERAGYDPEAASRLWRRLGPHPLNFLRSRDHPGWQSRVASFEAEIAKIRAARAAGQVPMPDFVSLPRAESPTPN